MPRKLYDEFSIEQLKKIKSYLVEFKKNYNYVLYDIKKEKMKEQKIKQLKEK